MVPALAMDPAWAGRCSRSRSHCRPAACRVACHEVDVCRPADCAVITCGECDPCGEIASHEPTCCESQAPAGPEVAAETPVPVAPVESIAAATAQPSPGPMPVTEPVPSLAPAEVAHASAEEKLTMPETEKPSAEAVEAEAPEEPDLPAEPEMKEEPAADAAKEEVPGPQPEPEDQPKPTPQPEPKPTPETAPQPAPQPEPKPEPPPAPAEKNIFEEDEAAGEGDEPLEEATSDEEMEEEPVAEPPADEDEPAPQPEENEEPSTTGEDPFAVAPPIPAEPVRRWVDDTGDHATVGRLVEVHPDRVRILKLNGAFTTVPLGRLSDTDRSYVSGTGERLAAKPRVTDTAGL